MVIGWFLLSCSLKTGITLPLDASTFPKRTETHRIVLPGQAERISSPILLVQPMILVGFTALSDEIIRKLSHPVPSATARKFKSEKTLLLTASWIFASIIGTCL